MTSQKQQNNKTILVIDDDPGVLLLAEEAFAHDDMEVCTVGSGEAALSQILEIKPDLVLLDIMMPDMDGFETCREIRKIPDFKNTPIIMLTGRDDLEAVESAYGAGAWDFTNKPVNWPILRHRVEYSLRAFEAFSIERKAAQLSKTLDKSSNEIIVLNAGDMKIHSANESALANLDYDPEELGELVFPDITSGISQDELELQLRRLDTCQQITLNLDLRRRDGSAYPVEGIILYNTEEQPHEYICILQDITERRKDQKRLHELAYYDDLTGLPNRRMFSDMVQTALALSKRSEMSCAVCILDLDGFKAINDAFGHAQGDLLLKQVADRLVSEIRQSDAVGRMLVYSDDGAELELARLGGDEFIFLLRNLDDSIVPARVADRILKTISLPYKLHGRELNITASIGIALYPDDGDCLEVLMQRADHAMYSAKKAGKNSYAYYSQESGMNSLARLTLETELRKAIARDELEIFYQPQIDGLNGAITGVEALVRWNHPEKGLLGPGAFIPVAEESGLIIPIGEWVMQVAMAQLAEWSLQYGPDFKCAVNISGLQMRQDSFLSGTRNMLSNRKRGSGRIVFELTESTIMTSSRSRMEWLHEIRELGAEIAIDDFGTGYSSLGYLKKLPIDTLKIDRSFVAEIASDEDDRAIINTIFMMAQTLGLKIIVEGVETQEQLILVNKMGKSLIQGYFFSPPLPVNELEKWIASRTNLLQNTVA